MEVEFPVIAVTRGGGGGRWLQEQREDKHKARDKRSGAAIEDKRLKEMTPEERRRLVPEEQRRLMGCVWCNVVSCGLKMALSDSTLSCGIA